jgi:dihydrofolate synthase/folylpolyglutamate synthase
MLADKDIAGVMRELLETADSWHLAGLAVERGATAGELAQALASLGEGPSGCQYPDVAAAFNGARTMAQPGDRVVVCGSFYTVTAVLKALDHERSGIE